MAAIWTTIAELIHSDRHYMVHKDTYYLDLYRKSLMAPVLKDVSHTNSKLISDTTSYFHMAVCHIYVLIFNIFVSVYPDTVFSVKELFPLFPLPSNYTSVPLTFFMKRCYCFTRISASQRWVRKTSGIRHNLLVVGSIHFQI